MNAVLLEQTSIQLTRHTSRWDRRLRLATSLIWVPRGLMIGLTAGIVVALISRLRPWLLPEQIVVLAGVALAISGVAALGLIWLWPRSKTQRARYFDQRFGLKERISTALELAGGLLPYSDQLAERQLNDAVGSAQSLNLAARLPLRVYWREIVAVIALVLLLGYLVIEDNPMNQRLRSQRDWQNALDSQIANLDETIQRIEQNPALSAEQKDALTQPLQQARDILQQKGVTQEEAVAAMAEASQSLKDQTNGMSSEQQAAYQNAASQLGRTGLTGDMADALEKPDLNAAANAMDDMSQQVGNGELSQQQQQQVADQLDSAAQQMQQADPQTAQHLSQAAKALRSGDQQAAQRAMRQAADSARAQQAQNQNSAAAQAAQNAAQQAQQSQQDLAQAGQQTTASQSGESPASEGAQPPGNTGQQSQQSQQQPSQSNQSQQSQSQAGQPQAGSGQQDQASAGQDQAGQPGEGQPQQADENQTQQQGGGNGPSDQGEGQPGNQPAGSGNQQGEGQGANAIPSAGDSTSGSQGEQSGALSAGSGEGGAGMDTTMGTVVEGNGQQTQANNGPQDSSMQDYNPAYDSTTIGGPVDQTVDVGGQGTGQEGDVAQEGDFGPNPAGESTLSYTGVYSSYQGVVSDALESGRIPLDQRDVIHDYFSSLDR